VVRRGAVPLVWRPDEPAQQARGEPGEQPFGAQPDRDAQRQAATVDQVGDLAGDLLGRGDSPLTVACEPFGIVLDQRGVGGQLELLLAFGHVGTDRAGLDDRHLHAEVSGLEPECLAEHFQGRLGGRIHPLQGRGEPAGRRGDVQDAAGASFPHGRQHRLHHPQRSQHVGRSHLLDQGGWHGLDRPAHRHRGVVDDHLQPPGLGNRRRLGEVQDEPLGGRKVGQIRKPAAGRDHLVAAPAQLCDQGAAQPPGWRRSPGSETSAAPHAETAKRPGQVA
jgi:hypothetical protein